MIRALLIALCLAGPLAAQDIPDHQSSYVNDFIDLLTEADTVEVEQNLRALRDETGIEMTVVTLESRHDHGEWERMEDFATALFNDWGIGDATRNDGLLFLVLRTDREMRIEIGSGYDRGYDYIAQNIIDEVILPEFRADRMSEGIRYGTEVIIDEIAMRKAGGLPPDREKWEAEESGDGTLPWPPLLFFVPFVAVFGLAFLPMIKRRLRRCPNCGRRTVNEVREVTEAATRSHAGRGMRHDSCRSCDWRDTTPYTISRIRSSSSSSSSGGSFGGGSSSGGGASGRW